MFPKHKVLSLSSVGVFGRAGRAENPLVFRKHKVGWPPGTWLAWR